VIFSDLGRFRVRGGDHRTALPGPTLPIKSRAGLMQSMRRADVTYDSWPTSISERAPSAGISPASRSSMRIGETLRRSAREEASAATTHRCGTTFPMGLSVVSPLLEKAQELAHGWLYVKPERTPAARPPLELRVACPGPHSRARSIAWSTANAPTRQSARCRREPRALGTTNDATRTDRRPSKGRRPQFERR
jgi:hypothetical protein